MGSKHLVYFHIKIDGVDCRTLQNDAEHGESEQTGNSCQLNFFYFSMLRSERAHTHTRTRAHTSIYCVYVDCTFHGKPFSDYSPIGSPAHTNAHRLYSELNSSPTRLNDCMQRFWCTETAVGCLQWKTIQSRAHTLALSRTHKMFKRIVSCLFIRSVQIDRIEIYTFRLTRFNVFSLSLFSLLILFAA